MKRFLILALIGLLLAPIGLEADKQIHRNEPIAARRTVQAHCVDADTGLPSTHDKTGAQPWVTLDTATSTTTTGAGTFTFIRNDLYHVALTQALVSVFGRHIVAQFSDSDVNCAFEPIQVVGIWSGTAQAGGAKTITLDSGASSTNSFYNGGTVTLTGGTGVGQIPRQVVQYVGSTRVATVSVQWTTTPDNTTTFDID